ncbi:alpha/beta fold hydrolase [Flavihumibacter sp. UBA7668]|uniref:alpha/beta fold hydrolase n=1 Tax=Flavihumibacter sp. UBA7668 TaxID=1946542 RepID=UPI0025C0C7AB|nr:alpha/beta hydrolase [Flavihumibacter sp. UBA7668]
MRFVNLIAISVLFLLTSCRNNSELSQAKHSSGEKSPDSLHFQNGYATVNKLKMYYEVYGDGEPLVLLHGGGSTIQTSFGKIIPLLAKNRKLIAIELQAHGRTGDRPTGLSFTQDADDVAELLKSLNIPNADFLGFSNGGTTVLQIAIRHPESIKKMILCSALAKRDGVPAGFWDFMKNAQLESMPEQLKSAYLKLGRDSIGLQTMHDKDVSRMNSFTDIDDELLSAINSPALIITADKDVITPEHAIYLSRKIKDAQLAILPGIHGEYLGEITTIKPDFKEAQLLIVPLINQFLR